jgi:hypothetical protein
MDIVGCNKQDTCDLLKKMIEDEKIYCNESIPKRDSDGQWTQGNTLWYIKEEQAQEKIITPDIQPEIEEKVPDELKQEEVIKSDPEEESIEETRQHQWYINMSNLTVDDFYIYLTTEDEKLIEKAEKRIESISKSENGKTVVDRLMAEAEWMVEKEEREWLQEQKRKEKYELLQKFEHFKGTGVWLHNGELVDLHTVNVNVNDIKEIGYLEETYDTVYGNEVKEYAVVPVKWQAILDGDGVTYTKVSDEIMNKMKQRFIEVAKDKKMFKKDIRELREYVGKLCDEANEGRSIDEEWEGDVFIYDGKTESNESMGERRRKANTSERNKRMIDFWDKVEGMNKKKEKEWWEDRNIEEIF